LEDGYKLGRITFEMTKALLTSLVGNELAKFDNFYAKILDLKEKISFLRSIAITTLVNQSAEIFVSKQDELLSGDFDMPLTGVIPSATTMGEISELSVEKIYKAQPIVEVEIAGFEVLADLLDTFLNAVFNQDSKQSKMVRQLIPDRYFDKNRQPFADKYQNIISITEFVSGLTDNIAIDLYKKYKGISL
jgi:dGTPase